MDEAVNRPLIIAASIIFLLACLIIIYSNPVLYRPVVQNVSVVTTDWQIPKGAAAKNHEIEGYASADSVIPGQTISFAVSSSTVLFNADIYRLGWYAQSASALKLMTLVNQAAQKQSIPAMNTKTGLIEPSWPYNLNVRIPTNWIQGLYLVKLTNANGFVSYIPFVVKSPQPTQSILFIHSDLTDQAYNDWGGNSLYHGSTPDLKLTRAVTVSLRRPIHQGSGAGYVLTWEYPMVRFLEKNHQPVDYATDTDIHNNPQLLQKYKLVLIVGHDEYWTKAMRDGYEAAVKSGTNLGIFAANTAYRQVRLEGDTEVGYKSAYQSDPMYQKNNAVVTSNWRDVPVNRPESTLIGSSYGTEVKQAFPYVVQNSTYWIYQNTGLKDGDIIPDLVGYECDAVQSSMPLPANLITLSNSPITNTDLNEEGNQIINFCNASIYTAPSGATVFNAGTNQWSSGLDGYHEKPPHVSPALQTITLNILNRLGK